MDAIVTNLIEASDVRRYAQTIASERGWPEDWLNDGAKRFLTGQISANNLFKSPGIEVYRPGYDQLLAMKLCAWRDDVDVADARRLLLELPSDPKSFWERIIPFLRRGHELKARYAFDDLWEARNETA